MTSPQRYLLDACVLIEAAKRYYAFDIAPQFWTTLLGNAQDGRVGSIDRVFDEISRGQDELQQWTNTYFRGWFVSTNRSDVLQMYGKLMAWANGQSQYTEAAKAEFAQAINADAWVVAFACVTGDTVVTQEQFNNSVKKRIMLPNVCQAFNVQYIDTFQMLRQLRAKL